MCGERRGLRAIDEGAVCTPDHAIDFRTREVREDRGKRSTRLSLPDKWRARMCLQLQFTLPSQDQRRGTLGERCARQMPGVIRFTERPVAFLRAHHHHLLNVTRLEQLSSKVQRRQADGCVTNERVTGAVNAEQRGEMA